VRAKALDCDPGCAARATTRTRSRPSPTGSNYRSAVYTYDDAQRVIAQKTRATYQAALKDAGRGAITSELAPLRTYTRAEDYHQDYLKKNPSGYCGLGGTGVKYPGLVSAAKAPAPAAPLDPKALDAQRRLIVFEADDCAYCINGNVLKFVPDN